MVDMDMVDQRNVTQCNLSCSWIRWTNGHGQGHGGPRKQSISMVHYWVRHAKCTWSSFNLKARDASASKIFLNSCACPGSAKPEAFWISALPSPPVPDGPLQGCLAGVRVLQDRQHHCAKGGRWQSWSLVNRPPTSRSFPTRCSCLTEFTLRQR